MTRSQATATKFLETLRTGTIGTLRSTSRFLEQAATRLESAQEPNPLLLKITTGATMLAARFAFALERVAPLWKKLLTLIRDRLPADLNGKFGDRTLSGILIGSIVVLFWFTSSLFSSKPAQPVQVATRPPVTIPAEPTQFPTDLSAPETALEVVSAPVIEEPVAEIPVEEPIIEAPVEEPIAEVPPVVEPSPEPIVELSPEPSPEPELTPEQKQIAAIQTQVMEISDRFIGGLVTSVEPQIDRDRLKVRVSEDWYRFSSDQQDRFANELWEKSQSIELPKLEITDAQGALIARPPIVGDSMIILQRKAV
ncbi:DNA segregation ATPase FtsK/SpoIIIE and related proteins [Leptolyngbya sp. NIES-2104]|nr:DNA segregation ATPase FtsK/SpoIIIE and related proteins [Leptolyngbya sp. NIES-2104]